jgi:RNA polymerase sigma-70 factor (ECF subfamily)
MKLDEPTPNPDATAGDTSEANSDESMPRSRNNQLRAVEPVIAALPVAFADDAALVRAITEGHPAAARAAYRRFSTLVRTLVLRSLGPGEEIEDHVQETFLRLFRHARELRDPSALSSFVVGIAMRVARSELRRRRLRRWLTLTSSGQVPEVEAPRRDLAAREAVARLYAILDRIDDECRLAFVLRHVQGMELAEVAAALGVSLATVKRRLEHATRRIQVLGAREPALAAYLNPRGSDHD